LLFAVKPFIGFAVSGHLKSSVKTNILVKIFSKRKVDDVHSAMNAMQKLLTDPASTLFLRFSFLLALLFPLVYKLDEEITAKYLHQVQVQLQPKQLNLFTGQLLI
jgi:hypothetical protein